MKAWKCYERWVLRRARTAQCSPALAVLGMVVVAGAVIYVYRDLILKTIELAALTAGTVLLLTATTVLVVSTVRWYRKRPASPAPEPEAGGGTAVSGLAMTTQEHEARVSAEADAMAAQAMGAEAGWLAADEVNLAVGPDGKLLVRNPQD